VQQNLLGLLSVPAGYVNRGEHAKKNNLMDVYKDFVCGKVNKALKQMHDYA
jgi:hypothetical protein